MAEKLIAEILIRAGVEGVDKALSNLNALNDAISQSGSAASTSDKAYAGVGNAIEKLSRAYIEGYGSQARFITDLNNLGKGLNESKLTASAAAEIYEGMARKMNLVGDAASLAARGYTPFALEVAKTNAALATQAEIADRTAASLTHLAQAQQTNKEIQSSTGLGVGPGERRGTGTSTGSLLSGQYGARESADVFSAAFDQDAQRAGQALEQYEREQRALMVKYEARQREIGKETGETFAQEFQKGINDGLRVGASALDAGAGSGALEQYFARQEQLTTKYEVQQREEGQRAGQAFAKGYQEALNSRLNVNLPSATSQGAGFEALAADMERAAQKAKEVRAAIDPMAAAQERLNEKIREYGSLVQKGVLTESEHAKAVAHARGEFTTYSNQLRIAATQASALEKATGLSGRSLINLQYQLNDIVSGLAMGQSPFMIMTQQGGQVYQVLGEGQGGVSGTLSRIGSAIGRIPTLAWAGLGAAGLAGAAGFAASKLLDMRNELDRAQAAVRALNTGSASDAILQGAKGATAGTTLNQTDAQGLSQTATRNSDKLGLQNADQLTRSAVALAVQLKATTEESQKALAALNDLFQGTEVTGAQAVKFAKDFPQFAGAIARAFDTTTDKVLDIDPAIHRVTSTVARAVEDMGKGAEVNKGLASSWDDLKKAVADAALAFDTLTGTSSKWDAFWHNVAKGLDVVTQGMNNMAAAASAARAEAERAAQFQANGIASSGNSQFQTQSGSNDFGYGPTGLPVQYNQFPGYTGAGTSANSPGEGATLGSTPLVPNVITANVPPSSFDPLERAISAQSDYYNKIQSGTDNLPTINDQVSRVADFGKQGLERATATADGVKRVYDASQMGVGATKAADTANRQGLSGVENAVRNIRIPAGGGGSPMASVSRKDGGGPTLNVDGLDKAAIDMAAFQLSGPAWMYPGNNSYVANNTVSAMSGGGNSVGSISAALPEGFHLVGDVMSGYKPAPDKEQSSERLSEKDQQRFGLGKFSPTAQAANQNIATTAIGNPVSDAIQRLQGQQDAVMGRQYTPDAYTDKNPDQFYSGGKIFTEQQDKQFTALQKQIDHLTSLRTMAEAQLKATQTLPQSLADALVTAMVKAGLSGDQIAAAMNGLKPTTTGTSQPGYLANANGATRTRMTIGA